MTAITQAYRGGDAAGRPGWWFSFTYDQDTIDLLKRSIPASQRAYNPETKRWWVSAEAIEALRWLLPGIAAYEAQPALF